MPKQDNRYAVLSWDGQRSCGLLTKQRAQQMVEAGEAEWCEDRAAVRLRRLFYPDRGLSASPGPRLTERYVEAVNAGIDPLAVAAVEGWSNG